MNRIEQYRALDQQLLDILRKAKAGPARNEASALDFELLRLDVRQDKWVKVSKAVSYGFAMVVFFVTETLPDIGFHYESLLLALVLGTVSVYVALIGLAMLGKFMMRAQYADWAQRAERVVREHSQAAS